MVRRLWLTDDQGRRLAAKGRRLGRRVLRQVATIVTPDTSSVRCQRRAKPRISTPSCSGANPSVTVRRA
jgi:hypothetical protein